jgi:hypothetical protein
MTKRVTTSYQGNTGTGKSEFTGKKFERFSMMPMVEPPEPKPVVTKAMLPRRTVACQLI